MIVVFDLDGTLSILGDRLKYIRQEKPDWDSFYEACDEDTVNQPIAATYRALSRWNQMWIVTGRRESVRQKTLDWLDANRLPIYTHRLLMRPDGDFRHDTIVKPQLVVAAGIADKIDLVFEDRATVVDMWRGLGITCAQVAEGKF